MNTDNLTSALGILAEKLGVAVSEIYNVLIAQARVSIIQAPIKLIGYGLLVFTAVLLVKKCFFERKYGDFGEKVNLMQHLEEECTDAALVTLIVMNLVMCAAAVVASVRIIKVISNCVTAWMNPQFYALDYIFNVIS